MELRRSRICLIRPASPTTQYQTVAISQIQSDGQSLLRNIPALLCHPGASLLSLPVSFIACASSTLITWERTASRRRPAFSSHLVSQLPRKRSPQGRI